MDFLQHALHGPDLRIHVKVCDVLIREVLFICKISLVRGAGVFWYVHSLSSPLLSSLCLSLSRSPLWSDGACLPSDACLPAGQKKQKSNCIHSREIFLLEGRSCSAFKQLRGLVEVIALAVWRCVLMLPSIVRVSWL